MMEHGRPKLTRSKAGCTTCREKRIKCGEEKPNCEQCRLANRVCNYQSGIKTPKGEKMRSLQPRDGPVAIRPKGTPGSKSPQQSSPDLARAARSAVDATPSTGQAWQMPNRPIASEQTTTTTTTTTGTLPIRQLPALPAQPKSASDSLPSPNPNTTIWATDANTIFKASFDAISATPSIVSGSVRVPAPISLSQYCFAASSTTSAPANFIRNTYLAKFTTGPFLLSSPASQPSIGHLIDELDPSLQLAINDPMRLRGVFSNSCFQESCVLKLRDCMSSPIYELHVWWTALFLLAMSLELGMFSSAEKHASEALSCQKLANIKVIMKSLAQGQYPLVLVFLTEVTFRYSVILSLLTGSRPVDITEADLLPRTEPLDLVMRTTFFLRIRTFDILHTLVYATDQPEDRERARVTVDRILWELYETERHQRDHAGSQTLDRHVESPFGYKVYGNPDWAHAAMSLLFLQILLSNVVAQFSRQDLLREYFAILGHVLQSTTLAKSTLDVLTLSIASALLVDQRERRWVLDALRSGIKRGSSSLLIPFETFELCLVEIWQTTDQTYSDHLTRDWEIIRTVQRSFKNALSQ